MIGRYASEDEEDGAGHGEEEEEEEETHIVHFKSNGQQKMDEFVGRFRRGAPRQRAAAAKRGAAEKVGGKAAAVVDKVDTSAVPLLRKSSRTKT